MTKYLDERGQFSDPGAGGSTAPAVTWTTLTGKPAVIAAGADQAAARTAIGAGTPYTLPAATAAALGGVKQGVAVVDAAAAPTKDEFGALLKSLRDAGIIAQ
ncbi:hypothetical protein KCT17_003653 [Escherichia coli]|nr:hypothetical protein [Escherichia coli]